MFFKVTPPGQGKFRSNKEPFTTEDEMIRLTESIHVNRPVEPVFRYTADFGRTQEWDPGVVSSKPASPGNPGVGTIYNLVLKFGPFRPEMRYEILAYIPFSKVVLKGTADSFSAVDTICFSRTRTGTRIDYRAEIEFSGLLNRMGLFLSPVLKETGRNAITGLRQKLNNGICPAPGSRRFSSGSGLIDYVADHMILPGMLTFGRPGYEIRRRFWTENRETLYGKRVVITGGTSGIGKAAALKLAEKRADLTIIARNRQKAAAVQKEMIEQTGNPHVDFLLADLGVMTDIKRVAARLIDRRKSVDILINNAGALFNDREETPEGLERTFATDLLGVFYLTQLLKDRFNRNGARIINVSSGGMYTQKIDVDDLQNRQLPYNGAKAYARAKRGIVILTRLWAEQLCDAGIAVHAMHPGWVDTPGIASALPGFHSRLNSILRTPEQGADTIVWLASAREAGLRTGLFWLDRQPRETHVFPNTVESETERQTLWQTLKRLTADI